jgi:hypothetical protein
MGTVDAVVILACFKGLRLHDVHLRCWLTRHIRAIDAPAAFRGGFFQGASLRTALWHTWRLYTMTTPMNDDSSTLVFRRNLRGAWIWELHGSDGHVCNRSEIDFVSRAEAEVHATNNGQNVIPLPEAAADADD